MTIYPTLFTQSVQELDRQLQLAADYFPVVQIDIADGILVEGSTITLEEALTVLKSYPHIKYDMHLMVKNYQQALDMINSHTQLQFRYVLLHTAAAPDAALFADQSLPYQLGIVINPDENLDTISHIYPFNTIPAIQIMTVVPGAQGRPFEEKSLLYIDQLVSMHYKGDILLDGGINATTLKLICSREHTPTIVGPGSYFSKAQSKTEYAEKVHELEDIIESACA